MHYFHWIAGTVLALAWFSRIVDAAIGMPSVADVSTPEWDRKPVNHPRVSIIVPARNEEADIEVTLARLLALDYENYEVIAVNDRSTDRTGEIMETVAAQAAAANRLRVIHHRELPAGWMGKTHAMWTAANCAPFATSTASAAIRSPGGLSAPAQGPEASEGPQCRPCDESA